MRIKVLVFLFIVSLGLLIFPDYPVVRPINNQLGAIAEAILYKRDIHIASDLNEGEKKLVAALLPATNSTAWWHLNLKDIARKLEQHPRVREATLKRCSWIKLGCFNLEIAPARPKFIATVKNTHWYVGPEGDFLEPVTQQVAAERYVEVQGAFLADRPALVKSRLKYVSDAIQIIEERTDLTVNTVKIEPNGELEVVFENFNFLTTFDHTKDSPERLHDEALRLRSLLQEFSGNEERIESIDLAFNKLGVVRLKK